MRSVADRSAAREDGDTSPRLVEGWRLLLDGHVTTAARELGRASAHADGTDRHDVFIAAHDAIVACVYFAEKDLRRSDADGSAMVARDRWVGLGRHGPAPLVALAHLADLADLTARPVSSPISARGHRADGFSPVFAECVRAKRAEAAGDVVRAQVFMAFARARLRPGGAGPLLRAYLDRTPPRRVAASCPLTHRERVVLRALCGPLTLAEIAAELNVSRNTVKSQASSAFRKLGVRDRAGAVRSAREQRWL